MTCSSRTRDCIKSKCLWTYIFIIIFFLLLYFVFERKPNDDDDHNFSVNNSTVISFSYNTTTTTFTYNLLLYVIVPDIYVSHDYVNATASYLNHRFPSKPDETFVQGFTGLRMRFNGNFVVAFTQDQLSTLQNDHMVGLYNVTIRIWPSKPTQRKIGLLKTLVLCDIQVPFQSKLSCDWTTED
ncbi:hypothetical protein V8G54_010611 [Vigna mungo]|uniref:Late embryogenesis abundant protein LEA-2 subgroup domain-containing protein n=1 Tax=Vigna mungo TaxID=3915 RepID=A0AAQ3S6L5_VIGMU